MPDVKIFVDGQCVDRDVKEAFLDYVPVIVAEEMSCRVWGWKWPFFRYQRLDAEHVDVMVFRDDKDTMNTFDVFSNSQIIIEVAAYNFLDRRRNLNKRILRIARKVKAIADGRQYEDFKTTITFIPIKGGYWARA